MKRTRIAILGAGSWGTAIALHLATCGHEVFLWAHDPTHVQNMQDVHSNQRYLPDHAFPKNLHPMACLSSCLKEANEVIIAVPSHAFSEILDQLPKNLDQLAWITKGIDPKNNRLLGALVAEKWHINFPMAIISGPSFAKEVANLLPTALTIASNNALYAEQLRDLAHYHNVRVYLSNDLVGVQLCGAVKNVLAIACGISDGLNYGANAKAALITRGLAEMSRLGLALGAQQETFIGLAGVGDLVLTCTDDQSRNRRFGRLLGEGQSIEAAEKKIGQVVEGKYNAGQVCALAKQHRIEMPICQEMNAILQEKISAKQAADNLMNRPPRSE